MNKVYVMFGLLVVVALGAFILNYDSSGKGPDRVNKVRENVPKPPAIDQNRVFGIEVSDGSGTIKVQRLGDSWVMPDKFNAPVQAQKANDLLKALVDLDKAERVADTRSMDARYGLGNDKGKRVKLFDENKAIIVDLWVGKADTSAERNIQAAGNYVRVEGSDVVYSHGKRLEHLVMTYLTQWVDGRLFPIEPKDINDLVTKANKITLDFDDLPAPPQGMPDTAPASQPTEPEKPVPHFRVTLTGKEVEVPVVADPAADVGPTATAPKPGESKPTTKKEKQWALAEPADAGITPYTAFVDQIVRTVLYGRLDDVVGSDPSLAEYGLDRPVADVEITFADGSSRRLKVGKKAPPPSDPTRKMGSFRFANVVGSPRVVLVNEYTVVALRKKPADLKSPEIPKPAANSGPQPIELPKDEPETKPAPHGK